MSSKGEQREVRCDEWTRCYQDSWKHFIVADAFAH